MKYFAPSLLDLYPINLQLVRTNQDRDNCRKPPYPKMQQHYKSGGWTEIVRSCWSAWKRLAP